jgi:hypothetical protein
LLEYPLDHLVRQVELMERLLRHRVEESWAVEAIRDSAAEIERVAGDDLAADYARDVRRAASGNQLVSGETIAESFLGERVQRLSEYCALMQQGPAGDVEMLRPWG